MEKTINSFSRGINQDLAKTVYKEGNYLDGLNITLLTDSGLSTAVVQNKKGTKLQFKFPTTIPQATYEASGEYPVTIPAQTNLTCIGGVEINETIFLFTISTTNGIYDGIGQIWRCNIDEITENTSGTTNGYQLTVANHMMYNRNLNFRKRSRLKIVGKYENENFRRLYWTDGRNPLRTINTIGSLSDLLNIPQRTLNIVSEANLETPTINRLVTGNLPEGKYQVAYRLLSKEGTLTRFSTCSNLIDVIEGNEYNSELDYPLSNTIEFTNDNNAKLEDFKELKNSQKGIEFYIDKIDKDYQMIQYAIIYYSEPDIPEIYCLPYKEISLFSKQYDTITELYEDTFSVNIEDFNMFYSPFEVVKTLEVKENTLFVANTSNEEFKVNVDYRAYRFNNAGESTIYELDGTSNTFTSSNYPNNLKLDAINPYNDDSGKIFNLNPSGTPEDWYNNQQYKFKADGITPGGSGPNIEYSFNTTSLVVDTNSSSQSNKAPFVKTEVDYNNLPLVVGNNHIKSNNGSYSSLKSPYKSSCIVSFQRGEVYRFGLTFYNKKGQPSYVNWIGDIKMPDFNEFNTTPSLLCSYDNDKLIMYSVQVDFDVTIPNDIAEDISGFRIVYVQRESKDKTRFGTGITGGFEQHFKENVLRFGKEEAIALIAGISCSLLRRVIDNMVGGTSGGFDPFNIKNNLANKICEAFATFIKQKLTNTLVNIDRITTPGELSNMIASILEGVTNQKEGLLTSLPGLSAASNIIKLFSPRIIELITNLLKENLEDMFNKKVAGLHKNVLSLGKGFAYSQINSAQGSGILGNIISPIIDFNRYHFRQGDFLRPIQGFHINNKLVNEIHRDTTVGIYNPIDSSAYIRKWYNGTNFNWESVADTNNRRIYIKNQKVFIPGELLGTGFDSLLSYSPNSEELDFIISNSFINRLPQTNSSGTIINSTSFFAENLTTLANAGLIYNPLLVASYLLKFGKGEKVLGIGDKKHLIISDIQLNESGLTNFTNFNKTDAESNLVNLDIHGAEDTIRNIDYGGDFTVSYNRSNSINQYNGIGYTSRANNIYIPASEFMSLTSRVGGKSYRVTANLGDAYVGVYGAVNYCYYYDQIKPDGYQKSIRTKKGLYEIFPCEADFNFTLREGKHVINNLSPSELEESNEFKVEERKRPIKKFLRSLKEKITRVKVEPAAEVLRTKRFLLSDFNFNDVFNQKYNINTYMPESILYNSEVDIFSNRIWHSKRKLDGELIDSWRDFQLTDYIDVEGIQGPIQELVVNKNKLFFYQTNAIGIASTNERGQVTDSEGNSIVLSNGKLLPRYDYITKETGTIHQFSVVNTNQALYHYDGKLKKLFKLGDGLECISDNLGLFSKLQTTTNDTNSIDTTLDGIGVHAIYDVEYQTVYFTFLGDTAFTLNYNEKLNAFESRYSFIPNLYFKLNNKVFSSYSNSDEVYWHNKGDYGKFHGVYYPSSLTILTNDKPLDTKVWDNQQLQTQVYDNTNTLLNLETISTIRHKTENQDTGIITLNPQVNIIKKERDWKLIVERDTANATYSTLAKPRLRDMYLETTITYNNSLNKRIIIHPITTFYRQSIH